MTIIIPSDMELRMEYRVIAQLLNPDKASRVVLKLFTSLGLTAYLNDTLTAGVISSDVESWLREELGDGFNAALASRLLIHRDGKLICPLYAEFNPIRIFDWTGDTKMSHEFNKRRDKVIAKAKQAVNSVPASFWDMDGVALSVEEMERALSFIATLDFIFYKKVRKHKDLTEGAVHCAVNVIRKYSHFDLNLFLYRLFAVSRPMLNPNLPSITEDCILKFDMVCRLITPEEGFKSWYERAKKEEQRRVLLTELRQRVEKPAAA